MKMKQTMKRLLACTLAVAMLMTLPVATKAQAAVKDNLPKKVRIYTSNTPWSRSVELTLEDPDQSIENVRSSSKNLKVELVGSSTNIQQGNVYSHSFTIGILALKDGTYTVSYDIVKNDKVVSTKKMEVYAYPSPIKSFTLDGKNDLYYENKTTGKVKVTLASGNTIKKLEVGTYKKITDKNNGQIRSELSYKTFKNGASVKFGTMSSYNKYESGDRLKDENYSGNLYSELLSYTMIRITYKDKYTKQEETVSRTLYGLAK